MKHIAFLIPTLNRVGGAERQVVLLAQGLARRRWRVTIVALTGTPGETEAELRSAGIAFQSLEMRKGLADPRGWIRLNRWLRREQPEILHAHLPHAAWIARWSRFAAPVRVVIDTIHTSGTGTPGRKLGYRCSNWLTDQVTAVSSGAAEAWQAARMVPRKMLEVVPNGIDTDAWKPDPSARASLRAELKLKDEFLWLAAGRLEQVKNFPALLSAFAALPANAHLVIAGSGSQAEALWSRTRDLGIENRVRFPGYQANLLRWMQAADGFVLPSLCEGLPISLLEAGACGLAAVSTAVAGATEILVNELTGFLAADSTPEALSATMQRLMETCGESRRSMGKSARRRIESLYGICAALDHWEDLYIELLAARPVAARTGTRTGAADNPRFKNEASDEPVSPSGAGAHVP